MYYTSFAIAELDGATVESHRFENQIIWSFLKNHKTLKHKQHHLLAPFEAMVRLSMSEGWPQRRLFLQEWMRLLVLQIMASLTTAKAEEPSIGRDSTELDRVLQAIDMRLEGPIRVEDIARSAGMSERSLQRFFRRQLNRTLRDEIQERRMQRAASLLVLPEWSVAEVGRRVGIDDPGQFSRLFKKRIGLTPRQFRSTHSPAAHAWIQEGAAPMKTEFLE
jgi:AraC-like DNA-binding protein